MRIKRKPFRSIREVNFSDPAVSFWFFGQVPVKHRSNGVIKEKPSERRTKYSKNGDASTNDSQGRGDFQTHPLASQTDLPPLTDLQWQSSLKKMEALPLIKSINTLQRDGRAFEEEMEVATIPTAKEAVEASKERAAETLERKRAKESAEHAAAEYHESFKDESNGSEEDPLQLNGNKGGDRRALKAEREDTEDMEVDSKNTLDEDDADYAEDEDPSEEGYIPKSHHARRAAATAESTPALDNIKSEPSDSKPTEQPTRHPESSATSSVEDSKTENIKKEETTDSENKMNDLQSMICECITDNGGSCHFDMIVHHVSKGWNKIKGAASQDIKSAVLSALTDSKRLFKRDMKKTGWWMIGTTDATTGSFRDETFTRSSRSKSRRGANSANTTSSQQQNALAKETNSMNKETPEEALSDDDSDKSGRESMTQLQILIIEAIDLNGGSATFEQIYEHVSKKFENLKRRDGTPYTSDCRRALQSSLSNNPTTRPFFKKENKKPNSVWTLAKRSLEFLAEQRKKNEEDSNKPKDVTIKEEPAAPPPTQPTEPTREEVRENSSEEEEIKDEGDDNSDRDEKKFEPKEDKHFYANRQKRARKIQAGKRLREQSSGEADGGLAPSKELRNRKKRR